MICSMTAFARREVQGDWGAIQLELRSVNHRYLELHRRLPEELRFLEPALRERIGRRLGRGKLDCTIDYQPPQNMGGELVLNHELLRQLARASREIDSIIYNSSPVNSIELLRWPGVLAASSIDEQRLRDEVLNLLEQTLDELIDSRRREGEKIEEIILQRCAAIESVVGKVRLRIPEVLATARQRLQERLEELSLETDQGRLEQEMVLSLQKLDVDEEMDRLLVHINEVRRVLQISEPVGRRLDFLMQELNREANTLGSKSADNETTAAAVELKVLIEQMREQIQNIE